MATQKKPVAAALATPPAATPARASYLVGSTPILCDGARFEPGAVIALTHSQAQVLGLVSAPSDFPPLDME